MRKVRAAMQSATISKIEASKYEMPGTGSQEPAVIQAPKLNAANGGAKMLAKLRRSEDSRPFGNVSLSGDGVNPPLGDTPKTRHFERV